MYHISFLRQLWPDEPIWMTKVDCKSAYRRIHLKAATAMKSCTYRRPAVSGAEDDVRWSAKPIAMERRVGDDHGLGKRPCPQGRLGSERLPLAAPAPPGHRRAVDNDKGSVDKMSVFGKADYFAVNYPPYDDLPRFDCYLDDIFGAFNPATQKERCRDPLALHLVRRPCDPEVKETFPRDDILAIPKFLAEAKPSERKMILGWIVDTRRFVVALPHDKHMSWTQAVDRMLTHRHAFVTTRDLETTLGRFSHAAYVIPYARHFMGRLYKACERSKQAGKARLTKPQLDDLILWKAFLQKASRELQDHPFAASPYFADWRLAAAAKTQLLPTQPVPSAIAAGAVTKDSSDESTESGGAFSQGLGRSESRNVRLLRRRPSGRTASLRQPQEAGNGPLSGSIRATLDGVAQAFRLNKFESPIHDAAGRLDPLLALQLKRYADEDPGPTHSRRCR
ncbi:hypothetical protein MHU86_16720 [Fragilaria crotonensis]|nr:hypothetical protein MHU86_16720 [Fragilaria crotonensis]